jgi:hypothetical protein
VFVVLAVVCEAYAPVFLVVGVEWGYADPHQDAPVLVEDVEPVYLGWVDLELLVWGTLDLR